MMVGGISMIKFDHVAITVQNLEDSISFYSNLGYKIINQFVDEEYRWATLQLNSSCIELFKPIKKSESKIEHLAYSYENDEEAFLLAKQFGYEIDDLDIYYGNLNRKSFFIEDCNGISIQLIKKKEEK